MTKQSRIVLPLDTDTANAALSLVSQLHAAVYGFKVGLELINVAGFEIFDRIKQAAGNDVPIFYDCKFHDIPNTVAGAVRAATRRDIWMLNIHASGGKEMMRAAVDAAGEEASKQGIKKPLVIAVTVLTSIDQATMNTEMGALGTVADHVLRLASLAQESGCDGVVASPHEVAQIRSKCGKDFQLVIPGVRPAGAARGDQKRVMTPEEAISAGANYLVIGRPITGAADPLAAAIQINEAILQ